MNPVLAVMLVFAGGCVLWLVLLGSVEYYRYRRDRVHRRRRRVAEVRTRVPEILARIQAGEPGD